VATVTEFNQESREIVARNITAQRERAGYSKRRLTAEAGVGGEQLRRWEAGTHEPSARNLRKIAHVLGQSLEWFYENHDGEAPDG
jgi:transcriptional regulator with XRE-family HTH domain